MRTNFLGSGSVVTPQNPIPDYTVIAEEKPKHKEDVPGNQIGDPQKIAKVIISSHKNPPPLRVLLRSDVLQFADYKIQILQTEIEANKEITLSTDFHS